MNLNPFHNRRLSTTRQALLALSVLGAAIMAYLAHKHYTLGAASVCNFSARLSCDTVNQSAYATLFGVPVAGLGFVYFLGVILYLLYGRSRRQFSLILYASAFALAFGLVLSGIEAFVLGAFCLFCETAKLIMALMIAASAHAAGVAKERLEWPWVGLASLAGLALGLTVLFRA